MNLTTMLTSIDALSIDDLKVLNERIVATIKHKRNNIGATIAKDLKFGLKVRVKHKDFVGETFTVQKVNRTKAELIRERDNQGWNIPFSMIEII
jgi:S-adenosylmethionine:tRNA-ribosyltransferase-isomerase (queuine synthetase)